MTLAVALAFLAMTSLLYGLFATRPSIPLDDVVYLSLFLVEHEVQEPFSLLCVRAQAAVLFSLDVRFRGRPTVQVFEHLRKRPLANAGFSALHVANDVCSYDVIWVELCQQILGIGPVCTARCEL